MKFRSDIDIDFADRTQALTHIWHVPAVQVRDSGTVPHNTGVYVTDIPRDPITNLATVDYRVAEQRGYIKLDFLNMSLYSQIRNEEHLTQLIAQEPQWHRLYEPEFCSQLIHIGNHYQTLINMPEAVNSIARMAMLLAVIRPGKRHLIGKSWKDVAATVWDKPIDGSYAFKRSHSVAYSQLVVVNMNLLVQQELVAAS